MTNGTVLQLFQFGDNIFQTAPNEAVGLSVR